MGKVINKDNFIELTIGELYSIHNTIELNNFFGIYLGKEKRKHSEYTYYLYKFLVNKNIFKCYPAVYTFKKI